MPTQILMPALSPTMTEGKLAKWLKKEGDGVKSGDVLAEIETDKATMEMEAVDEGVLGKILVPAGTEKVAVNKPIAILLAEGEKADALAQVPQVPKSAPPVQQAAQTPAPAAQVTQQQAQSGGPAPQAGGGDRVLASPLAKRIAGDAGVDLQNVQGSGPNGRIVRADVEKVTGHGAVAPKPAAPAQATSAAPGAPRPAMPPAPMAKPSTVPDFGQPFKAVPNSMVRKVIAKRLLEAKTTIPHFYLTIECNIDELMKLRAELNGREGATYKLSVNDFVIKAAAHALRKVPAANATWTDEAVRLYENVDISVAVATPDGLITPIIRNVDKKGLAVISNEMKDLATKARDKKLKPEEYQGGGFTISNLGMFGIKEFSAIINPPQVAILAVGKAEQRPIVRKGALAIATMMSCTMSCDHRVVDGAVGAEYLQAFQALIEDPLKIML